MCACVQVPSHSTEQPFDDKVVKNWYMFVCIAVGLWGGLLIGLQTEYFTSNRYKPVQVLRLGTATSRTGPGMTGRGCWLEL